jgi:hypothetical protein
MASKRVCTSSISSSALHTSLSDMSSGNVGAGLAAKIAHNNIIQMQIVPMSVNITSFFVSPSIILQPHSFSSAIRKKVVDKV